jgi:lysophospholipid acyltransferase (LPLAT)-like uncharacterized protein
MTTQREEHVVKHRDPQRGLHPDQFPFLPPTIALLHRLLHRTCKFTILGREYEEAALSYGGPILGTCWHFAFPAVVYYYRDRNGLFMVSRSRDGEWAARVLKHLGYRCFRGSPGKGGSTALKQLISNIRGTMGGGLIADGSQGPARIAQKGVLVLARYSGTPLLPHGMAAAPCWRFPSWDRTVLAKPFSRIVLAFGPPSWIAKDASADELEAARLNLENTLNQLTEEAEQTLARLV